MSQTAPVIAINRPYAIESWQWDGSHEQAVRIKTWINENGGAATLHPYDSAIILGDDFDSVTPGDHVIRDKFGDFFPLRDADYQATYTSPIPYRVY